MNGSKKPFNFWREWIAGWIPLGLVTAVILRSAVCPPHEIPRFLFKFSDKVLHGFEFFILALTAYQAFRISSWKWIHEKRFFAVPIYGSMIAFLSEWVQRGVPGRFFEIVDLAADAVGIMAALTLVWLIHRGQEKL